MGKKSVSTLFIILAAIVASGCPSKTNKNTGSSDTNTSLNNNGGGGGGSGTTPPISQDCYADGTGSEGNNYWTLPTIVAHGAGVNQVQWSSATDPRLSTPSGQNIFRSDARFNIRVVALESPGQGPDTYFNQCTQLAVPYGKLQVKVRLRKKNSYVHFATHIFDNIQVGGCSEVKEFSLLQSNDPFTIEVLETKWDYSCQSYCSEGFCDMESVCPWDHVWLNDCFAVEVQLATDDTRDIPH